MLIISVGAISNSVSVTEMRERCDELSVKLPALQTSHVPSPTPSAVQSTDLHHTHHVSPICADWISVVCSVDGYDPPLSPPTQSVHKIAGLNLSLGAEI